MVPEVFPDFQGCKGICFPQSLCDLFLQWQKATLFMILRWGQNQGFEISCFLFGNDTFLFYEAKEEHLLFP